MKWVCIYVLVAGVQGGQSNTAFGQYSSVSVGCSESFLDAFLSFVCSRAGIVFSLPSFVCVCVSLCFCGGVVFEVGLYLCFVCWCAGW